MCQARNDALGISVMRKCVDEGVCYNVGAGWEGTIFQIQTSH